MTTETTENSQPRGPLPTHRAWLVIDRPNDKPYWHELTALWPARSGKGMSGQLDVLVPVIDGFLKGRLVILPAKVQPDNGDAAQEAGGAE